jgi:hypothetical protein
VLRKKSARLLFLAEIYSKHFGEGQDGEPNRELQSAITATLHRRSNFFPAEYRLDHGFESSILSITMKRIGSSSKLTTLGIVFCAIAPLTLAHERNTFKIGKSYYLIVVGSLNEPFVVDNMSGVDLRVSQVVEPGGNRAPGAASNGAPVTGLERTLKVELGAGDKRETLPLDPSDRAPGSYTATFIPTVQTTYSYRVFGNIHGDPVNLIFTCAPGEVSETAEDNSQLKVSETVTRIQKVGAFACPASRKNLGFPEPSLSTYDLHQNTQNLAAGAQAADKRGATTQLLSIIGIVSGLTGLAVAIMALKRK